MTEIKSMTQEDLKRELEVIKDRFRSIESDWVFQDRCQIYQSDENKLLANLNARVNQIRCRLKYTFNWLDPDNRAGNWMI
jgi:hypothetical protein